MDLLVSIIVPVYKVESYLEKCIHSLVNQTYHNLEIILIDDESPDQCPDICDLWKVRDHRIKVIHNQHHGVSYSRNSGLNVAKGSYIAFCDSDDYYSLDYVAKMVENAEKYQSDITICSYYCIKDEKRQRWNEPMEERLISKDEFAKCIFLNNKIGGFSCNKLFRQRIIKQVRFQEDIQICEDVYFLFQVLQNTKRIFYFSDPLYNYRQHNASATGNIRNICSDQCRSKYTETCERILAEFSLNHKIQEYIKSRIFTLAIETKHVFLNAGKKDVRFIDNLNRDAKKYFYSFLHCREITRKRKAIIIGMWMFNLTKLRKSKIWRLLKRNI